MNTKLQEAIETFNRGDYFAASEQFEYAGVEVEDDLKALAGALNRIAAGLHLRFERGVRQATVNLLSQAMLLLDEMGPECGGVNVERLYAEVSAYTEEVRATPRDERFGLKHRARLFVERRRAPRIEFKREG